MQKSVKETVKYLDIQNACVEYGKACRQYARIRINCEIVAVTGRVCTKYIKVMKYQI
jgi:hypothetical protein